MATNVTVAGQTYSVPSYNEQPVVWGQGGNSVDKLLIALAANIASSPTFMQVVPVSATPTAMVSGKTYLVTTSVLAITLQMPTPAINTWFVVKDVSNNAFTNNITVKRAAAESIDGLASDFVITSSNASWIFVADGTNWWTVGSANDLRMTDIADGNRYQMLLNNGVISRQQL